MTAKDRTDTWNWLVLWTVLVLASIALRPLMPVDETRYLSVAWEMWQSKNFLVPHSNGLPYSHKPPLLFWFIHLGWRLFGVNAFSARLTGPLFGLLALFLTRRLAREIFPEKYEVVRTAPYILLGMLAWTVYGTLTMFDTLLTCMVLWALIISYRGAMRRSVWCWPLLGVALGLGVLAKGPVILVYCLPPVLFAPWWATQLPVTLPRWYLGVLAALAIGAGIALAWALPAAAAGGESYGKALLFGQTAGRVVDSFAHKRSFFWYLYLLPVVLFPWSCWLPPLQGLLRSGFCRGIRFLLSSLLPGLLLLSFISGKQVHYLLPMLPVAAILLARGNADRPRQTSLHSVIFFMVYGAVLVLVGLLPLLPVGGEVGQVLDQLPGWLGGASILALLVLFLKSRQRGVLDIRHISASVVIFVIFLQLGAREPLESSFSYEKIGAAVGRVAKERKRIAVYPPSLRDQLQFTAELREPLIPLPTPREMFAWSAERPGQYILLHLEEASLPALPDSAVAVAHRNGWLVLVQARYLGRKSTLGKRLLQWFRRTR